jgi:hypothetical protein
MKPDEFVHHGNGGCIDMALFQKGQAKIGGRAKGARNKISQAFLDALAADFEQHGEAAIKLMRLEKPAEYIKVVASILPKEFEITENRLMEIDDDTLDILLDYAKRRIADRLDRGETAAVDREPARLLPALC